MFKFFKGKKAYITGGISILVGIGMILNGDINGGVETIILGVSTITLRQGIAKK
jgi:hypothetical protein